MSRTVAWIIGMLAFVALCAATVELQSLHDEAHMRGGKTAWFALYYDVGIPRGMQPQSPTVLSGPFQSRKLCLRWLQQITDDSYQHNCQRMRTDDVKDVQYDQP